MERDGPGVGGLHTRSHEPCSNPGIEDTPNEIPHDVEVRAAEEEGMLAGPGVGVNYEEGDRDVGVEGAAGFAAAKKGG
jgi:hypothetical protein